MEPFKDTRLSAAVYALTKYIGAPKTVAVACWSDAIRAGIAGGTDTVDQTLAFWSPDMPHWINLSPTTCRAIETLLRNRPHYANIYTADAVQTLTHEMMHAIGISNEAQAECFGMQLSAYLARQLGVPPRYALSLSRLNLSNYRHRPPNYIDTLRCREDGAWDLVKGRILRRGIRERRRRVWARNAASSSAPDWPIA